MAEYSRCAKGSFTAPGTSYPVNLPFVPDFVQLWNLTNIATAGADKMQTAVWDSRLTQVVGGVTYNPTMLTIYNGGSATVADVIYTNGISSFQGALALQYGPQIQVASIPKADPTVVTTGTNHGYAVGDTVVMEGLYQSATTGMPQICGIPFTISAVTSNTFTIKWNSNQSNYTAISGSPTGAYVRKVLYPFLYVPQDNIVSYLTLGATTTVTTSMYHNLETGQLVAFRIPSSWGTTQLNSLPNLVIPGQPVYGTVVSITDNWTFVVNINSASYTAFNTNQTVASVPGLTFPQVVPIGDLNTGGNLISSSTTVSYPPPSFPTSSSRVPTINGPAIRGAFVNNTGQGFVIGAGTANTDTSVRMMAANDIIYWRAWLSDYANP